MRPDYRFPDTPVWTQDDTRAVIARLDRIVALLEKLEKTLEKMK